MRLCKDPVPPEELCCSCARDRAEPALPVRSCYRYDLVPFLALPPVLIGNIERFLCPPRHKTESGRVREAAKKHDAVKKCLNVCNKCVTTDHFRGFISTLFTSVG